MFSLVLDREQDSWKEESLRVEVDLFLTILFLNDGCFGWEDDIAAPYFVGKQRNKSMWYNFFVF